MNRGYRPLSSEHSAHDAPPTGQSASHRDLRDPASQDTARSRKPPGLDRMQISNLISSSSSSSDQETPPSEDTEMTSAPETHTSTFTTAERAAKAHQQHLNSRHNPNRNPSALARVRTASTPHSLRCSSHPPPSSSTSSTSSTSPPKAHFLPHHACHRCRRNRAPCTPRGPRGGCARCHDAGHACEIRTELLPRWSVASNTTTTSTTHSTGTGNDGGVGARGASGGNGRAILQLQLQARVVRVTDLGRGGGTRVGVRLVPACRCPVRIME